MYTQKEPKFVLDKNGENFEDFKKFSKILNWPVPNRGQNDFPLFSNPNHGQISYWTAQNQGCFKLGTHTKTDFKILKFVGEEH